MTATPNLIYRYCAIEIPLTSTPQSMFPDQSQLRGAKIMGVELLTGSVATESPVSQNSSIATTNDLAETTVTFVRGSDQFILNMPILCLNNINDSSNGTPFKFLRELFFQQVIDWNQCYLRYNGDNVGAIVSLGVYYYWDNNQQPKPY